MKFLCDNCKAKYQISDDKVAGKTVRMKCRKCGHQIEVKSEVTETSVSLPPPGDPSREMGRFGLVWQLRLCRAGFTTSVAEAGLVELARSIRQADSADRAMGQMAEAELALYARNWTLASESARAAVEFSHTRHQPFREVMALLILRAAERAQGHKKEVQRLGDEAFRLARTIGWDPPEQFGGRRDLLRLWRFPAR